MKPRITLFSLVMLSLLLAACGQQTPPDSAVVQVDMALRAEPEKLAVGDTTLIVTLTDASGAPLDGATLQIHGDMDHEGMMSVERETSESAQGEYRVPFEWTMGGGWIVTVMAHLPDGGEVSQTFSFFVEAVSSESIINRQASSASPAVQVEYQAGGTPADVVTVTLTDAAGRPITNAVVEVTGDMAHHGMIPVSGSGEHTQNGRYTVPMGWTMAGEWQVTVTVTLADGSIVEKIFDQLVVMSES